MHFKIILTIFILLFTKVSFASTTDVPIIIAITGGTGSGKSTLANKIHQAFPDDSILICQDFYYKDLSHLSKEEREQVNFDHPDSIEFSLLCAHLQALKNQQTILLPQYDFATHTRKENAIEVGSKKIVILEGILLLAVPELRDLLDLKLFIDADEGVRLVRRIIRDAKERGRSIPSILTQYLDTVKPMHLEFIEPSKRFADVIILEGGNNKAALDLIIAKIKSDLATLP